MKDKNRHNHNKHRLVILFMIFFIACCFIATTSYAKLIVITGDAECVTTKDGITYCISKDLQTSKESTRMYGKGDSIGQKGVQEIVKN